MICTRHLYDLVITSFFPSRRAVYVSPHSLSPHLSSESSLRFAASGVCCVAMFILRRYSGCFRPLTWFVDGAMCSHTNWQRAACCDGGCRGRLAVAPRSAPCLAPPRAARPRGHVVAEPQQSVTPRKAVCGSAQRRRQGRRRESTGPHPHTLSHPPALNPPPALRLPPHPPAPRPPTPGRPI